MPQNRGFHFEKGHIEFVTIFFLMLVAILALTTISAISVVVGGWNKSRSENRSGFLLQQRTGGRWLEAVAQVIGGGSGDLFGSWILDQVQIRRWTGDSWRQVAQVQMWWYMENLTMFEALMAGKW
ncbi:hypothetical protein Adt_02302 [Abeliophyllum distichum]|uniref:Uncharacterized protein n=1 Tax=Abeliophyllum distichum TaxID=126358 RepID=A0ABD1VVA1_9LAMI